MSVELNMQLARILGVDTKNVTAFTLSVEAGRLPELVVTSHFLDGARLAEHEQAFELCAIRPAEASNLDAQCEAAMRRVNQGINATAAHAGAVISIAHAVAMENLVWGPAALDRIKWSIERDLLP